ncbi:MAG TPA: CHASE3 domain-containing protein [Hyphomonadaceae bacterium]|nr:CHASE3 domain-containing protein [Hyphomonadaceae bacterium]
MTPVLSIVRSERFRTLASLLAGMALVIAMIAATIWYSGIGRQAAVDVRRAVEVRGLQTEVLSQLKDAETGQRGYLLTGEEAYLQPLDSALANLSTMMTALESDLRAEPAETQAMARLKEVAAQRLSLVTQTVSLRKDNRLKEAMAIVTSDRGKQLMDEARQVVAGMTARQDTLIALRIQKSDDAWRTLQMMIVASAIALVALAGVAIFTTNSSMRRMASAQHEAEDALLQRDSAEAQLRQSQRIQAVGQLTGGIAHDFNNMLAIVIGSLNLAKRRLGDPVKANQYLDNAMEGARRGAELTSRLLAFSRQQPLDPRPTDVNRLVAGMSELLRRTLGENVRVETVQGGGVWPTFIDAPQLESALVNLCVNARDAMPGGGKLTIETSNAHLDDAYAATHIDVKAGQYVLVAVTDTGTGMSREVMERAFDPFYTTKGPGKGTGLGLSQVYGFVKQSGGHIKLYSEIGQGTTVKVYLPRHFGEAATLETRNESATGPQRGSAETIILVVEDDDRVRLAAVESLRELGYTVVHANGATRALEIIDQTPRIDLLFTDVVMPETNGRQLADKARAKRPDLKVLFTTGYTQNAVVHNGILDPGVSMLQKPFSIEALAAKVHAALNGQQA